MTTASLDLVPSRARLQLSVGGVAELDAEPMRLPDRAIYRAVERDTGDAMTVTLFAAPPRGPDAALLRDRVDTLRRISHPLLELPVAVGDVDGCSWAAERIPGVTLRQRSLQGLLPLADGVAALRDVARALTSLHRHGMVHGALTVDAVSLTGEGAVLTHAAFPNDAHVADDIEALARVGWTLLTGERINARGRYLSQVRRGVSPSLDALGMSLFALDRSARPETVAAILDALDDIPTPRRGSPDSVLGEARFDVRAVRPAWTGWLLLLGAVSLAGWVMLQR